VEEPWLLPVHAIFVVETKVLVGRVSMVWMVVIRRASSAGITVRLVAFGVIHIACLVLDSTSTTTSVDAEIAASEFGLVPGNVASGYSCVVKRSHVVVAAGGLSVDNL